MNADPIAELHQTALAYAQAKRHATATAADLQLIDVAATAELEAAIATLDGQPDALALARRHKILAARNEAVQLATEAFVARTRADERLHDAADKLLAAAGSP